MDRQLKLAAVNALVRMNLIRLNVGEAEQKMRSLENDSKKSKTLDQKIDWFLRLPFDRNLFKSIEELHWPSDDSIIQDFLSPEWESKDNSFDLLNLEGISELLNLRSLKVRLHHVPKENMYANLSEISQCLQLEDLYLHGIMIKDLSVFLVLPRLRSLDLQVEPNAKNFAYARELFAKKVSLSALFIDSFMHGDAQQQVDLYSDLLERTGEDIRLYEKRAIAWHMLGDYRSELADRSKIIELEEKNDAKENENYLSKGLAYEQRALAYVNLGEYDPALDDVAKAQKLDKENAEGYDIAAFCHLQKGNWQEGLRENLYAQLLGHEVDFEIENEDFYTKLNFPQVERVFSGLRAEFGPDAIDLLYLEALNFYEKDGEILALCKNIEKKIKDRERKAEKSAPLTKSPLFYFYRAEAENRNGDYRASILDYQRSIELDEGDLLIPVIQNQLADSYLQLKEFQKAEEEIIKAIQLDDESDFPFLFATAAEIFAAQKNEAKMFAFLEKALAENFYETREEILTNTYFRNYRDHKNMRALLQKFFE